MTFFWQLTGTFSKCQKMTMHQQVFGSHDRETHNETEKGKENAIFVPDSIQLNLSSSRALIM